MTNFDQYLKTDFKFALDSISYKQLPPAPPNAQMALTCRDLLEAKTELDKLNDIELRMLYDAIFDSFSDLKIKILIT